jgi:hypothetical protein
MKRIITSWGQLWPVVNILNEVANRIIEHDCEERIGCSYEKACSLLLKFSNLEPPETQEDRGNIPLEIELDNTEIKIIQASFDEALRHIEDWEFQTLIGKTIPETRILVAELTGN